MVLLHSNLILKSSVVDRFSTWFKDNSAVAYMLLGHPVYKSEKSTLTYEFLHPEN